MNSQFVTLRAALVGVSAVALTVAAAGCQLIVNPFTDELASQPAVTTPSVEGVRLAEKGAPTDLRRPYENMQVHAEAGTVTYGPLYFVDPLEGKGDDDGRFAWTGKDYLLFFHGHAQFLLHGIFWPVSVVAEPPWMVMSSDSPPQWTTLGRTAVRRSDGDDRPSRGL
ncbi:MAG: hypothetical protein ACYTFA_06900 [Planctomycetota bacterium]|jgi:hypothetical protein